MDDLRARILGRKSTAPYHIAVPEWGEDVWLRRLSVRERLEFERENSTLDVIDRKAEPVLYNRWLVRYVLATVCDESGRLLFSREDEEGLMTSASTAIERLCLAAMRINQLSAAEVAKLGEVSSEVRNGSSPSDSPAISG